MQGGIMTIEQGEEGAGRVKVSDMNGRVIGGGHPAEHFWQHPSCTEGIWDGDQCLTVLHLDMQMAREVSPTGPVMSSLGNLVLPSPQMDSLMQVRRRQMMTSCEDILWLGEVLDRLGTDQEMVGQLWQGLWHLCLGQTCPQSLLGLDIAWVRKAGHPVCLAPLLFRGFFHPMSPAVGLSLEQTQEESCSVVRSLLCCVIHISLPLEKALQRIGEVTQLHGFSFLMQIIHRTTRNKTEGKLLTLL